MTQAPYQWVQAGVCVACGAPIYGRVKKPGTPRYEEGKVLAEWDTPEAQRTCPVTCMHGSRTGMGVLGVGVLPGGTRPDGMPNT